MAETTIAPPARRALTDEQFAIEACERFGDDPAKWAFECPSCHDIATAAEFPGPVRFLVGGECIGRHVEGRGCQRTAAAGLVPGPWLLRLGDGTVAPCFPLAPAPSQAPQSALWLPEGIGGPEDAQRPSAGAILAALAESDDTDAEPFGIDGDTNESET